VQLVALPRHHGLDLVVVERSESGEDEALLGSEQREGVAGVVAGDELLEGGQAGAEAGARGAGVIGSCLRRRRHDESAHERTQSNYAEERPPATAPCPHVLILSSGVGFPAAENGVQ
jgi:hypothetical protein